jgi:hypothetical protein
LTGGFKGEEGAKQNRIVASVFTDELLTASDDPKYTHANTVPRTGLVVDLIYDLGLINVHVSAERSG